MDFTSSTDPFNASSSVIRENPCDPWSCFPLPRSRHPQNEAVRAAHQLQRNWSTFHTSLTCLHPGRPDSETTTSFHRSLQTLTGTGFGAGLRLAGIEEWYSHKESQPGPRAKAENRARKEFPLFLALLWEKR